MTPGTCVRREKSSDDWYVYLVKCSDGTLYTGIARDIERRLREHDTGVGAKYTRGRGPVKLVAVSRAMGRAEASRNEARIKRVPRNRKVDAMLAIGAKGDPSSVTARARIENSKGRR